MPILAAVAATMRVWFDCTPPIETSVSAPEAIASGTMYSSLRSLLPPKARPELQSSRLAIELDVAAEMGRKARQFLDRRRPESQRIALELAAAWRLVPHRWDGRKASETALKRASEVRPGLLCDLRVWICRSLRHSANRRQKWKIRSCSEELDRTDIKILRLLQSDGRLGNAEIAKRVNTSAATCHRRIQRLFAEGYVSVRCGRRSRPRRSRWARSPSSAWCSTARPRRASATFEDGDDSELKLVLDCHIVAGDFDYFLKIRVRDMADFNKLHAEKLLGLPGVRRARTLLRDEGGRRQRAAGVLRRGASLSDLSS